MEAVIIMRDRGNNHRLMQIDLDLLAKDEELLEAVYNMIAIELSKNEKTILWNQAKKSTNKEKIVLLSMGLLKISKHYYFSLK